MNYRVDLTLYITFERKLTVSGARNFGSARKVLNVTVEIGSYSLELNASVSCDYAYAVLVVSRIEVVKIHDIEYVA